MAERCWAPMAFTLNDDRNPDSLFGSRADGQKDGSNSALGMHDSRSVTWLALENCSDLESIPLVRLRR